MNGIGGSISFTAILTILTRHTTYSSCCLREVVLCCCLLSGFFEATTLLWYIRLTILALSRVPPSGSHLSCHASSTQIIPILLSLRQVAQEMPLVFEYESNGAISHLWPQQFCHGDTGFAREILARPIPRKVPTVCSEGGQIGAFLS